MPRRTAVRPALAALVLVALAPALVAFRGADVARALDVLRAAYVTITQQYVDEVPASAVAEAAIRAMLKDLDPHSVYLTAAQMQRVREDFNAGFEGIGISFERLTGTAGAPDTIGVVTVIGGGPSAAAGLAAGDRIVRIGGRSALGIPDSLVAARLKGPAGSVANVSVLRDGAPDTLRFEIVRGRIPLHSVEGAYLLDATTGYVRLLRFSRTTAEEVAAAIDRLKGQGMRRLVFDLRGNGGGYLDQAVRVADLFLPEGKVVVTQKGRTETQVHRTTVPGPFETQPVVVLVDGASASASEIVAGALQDHDRALVVGSRSFGKGLVQQQRELADGSAIRVTIARYYTPTGRLIQTPYAKGEQVEDYLRVKRAQQASDRGLRTADILNTVPDSLKYRTPKGRVVLGGGGILPDVIARDSVATPLQAVLRQSLADRYVRTWARTGGAALRGSEPEGAAFATRYRLPDARYDAFTAFATAALADTARTASQWRADLAPYRTEVEAILLGRLATRLYGRDTAVPFYNRVDGVLREALLHWREAETLAANG